MSPAPRQTGFTLMELLVVIAIVGVLAGIGVPSFRTMVQSATAREAATQFYGGLARARSEAVARNTRIHVCARARSATPSCSEDNTWENGWLVFEPSSPTANYSFTGEALLVQPPLEAQASAQGLALRDSAVTTGLVVFDINGRATAASTFRLCRGTRPDPHGRQIALARNGRVSLETAACT